MKARAAKKALTKRAAKRVQVLERELLTPGSWPPSNPKLATARWLKVQELAHLKGVSVGTIKNWLEENYPSSCPRK